MNKFYLFVIRAILGSFFAVILMRFFYPKATIPAIMAVAVALVGLAYITEHFRKQKKGP